MQSLIKEKKGLRHKLEFTISERDVSSCFLKHYKKAQKKAKMPGFRQGKIPLETLKKTHKAQVYEAVLDDLLRSFYPQAVETNNIRPAGLPALLEAGLREGSACKFLLEVESHPEVKVENYRNLKLKKRAVNITDEDVAKALEKLRQSCAEFEDSPEKGPVKKGDFVDISIEGFSIPKKQKKLSYPHFILPAGENMLGEGFDSHLLGLRLNEEKEFDFAFPKNHFFHKISGLKLRVKVKIKGFKEKKAPALNDKLAQRFKLSSLEDLKSRVRKDLKASGEQKAQEEMERDILRELIKSNPVEIPESLIQEQKQRLKDNVEKRMREYSLPPAERAELLKERDAELEREAKDGLHGSYLMKQLIQDMKIQPAKEDITKSLRLAFPAKPPEEMARELKKAQRWNSFVFNLIRKKVIDCLIAEAHIIE